MPFPTRGDTRNIVSISVNDEHFSIRQNLTQFLLCLRKQKYARNVWADAISNRQDDPIEKNQQVGMIGDIYRNAWTVMVWVGEHADGSEALFRPSVPIWQREGRERRLEIWLSFI